MTRTLIVVLLSVLTIGTVGLTQGCGDSASDEEAMRSEVVAALDELAADLIEDRPVDTSAYTTRLQAYLEEHPAFFGSAAVLLDRSGAVIASPYVYRTSEGYESKDLATPTYQIEAQDWFTAPLAADAGVWTDPYFDEGGGDVWMVTRSLPVSDDEGTFVVITTDVMVEEPSR